MEFNLEPNHIQCMVKMVEEGPFHKDDVQDRLAIDHLVRVGLLAKIVFGGQSDFYAATYQGQQTYCKNIVGKETLRDALRERQKRGVITKCARY